MIQMWSHIDQEGAEGFVDENREIPKVFKPQYAVVVYKTKKNCSKQ